MYVLENWFNQKYIPQPLYQIALSIDYKQQIHSNPKWIKGIKGPIGKIRLLQLQFYDRKVQFTAFGTILYYLYSTKIRTGR